MQFSVKSSSVSHSKDTIGLLSLSILNCNLSCLEEMPYGLKGDFEVKARRLCPQVHDIRRIVIEKMQLVVRYRDVGRVDLERARKVDIVGACGSAGEFGFVLVGGSWMAWGEMEGCVKLGEC